MGFFTRDKAASAKGVAKAAAKPTPAANRAGQQPRATGSWHAVEVRVSRSACPACRSVAGVRYFSRTAPSLPVAGCTQPQVCRAAYVHHDDRRAEPRRDSDGGTRGLRSIAAEFIDRRAGAGRRTVDSRR